MTIDIDALSEAELIDLNHRIVERLHLLHQVRAHVDMLEFRIGDRVCFDPPGRGTVEGVLTRYNKKTVTVIAQDGQQWNVSPSYLRKVVVSEVTPFASTNVVPLNKRSTPGA